MNLTMKNELTEDFAEREIIARLMTDGRMECLGRQDFQVKIRGYRVELGEIEALLINHPDVRECSVIGREDQPGRIQSGRRISFRDGNLRFASRRIANTCQRKAARLHADRRFC